MYLCSERLKAFEEKFQNFFGSVVYAVATVLPHATKTTYPCICFMKTKPFGFSLNNFSSSNVSVTILLSTLYFPLGILEIHVAPFH